MRIHAYVTTRSACSLAAPPLHAFPFASGWCVSGVPSVVMDVVSFLEDSLDAPDLFVRKGNPDVIRALADAYDTGSKVELKDKYEACELLAMYCLALPSPLVCFFSVSQLRVCCFSLLLRVM
jgi:hypothetical protein